MTAGAVDTAGAASYGTRWRRTGPAAGLGLALVLGVVWMMKVGVLAAPGVVYQGKPAKFSSGRVTGQDVGFGMSTMTRKNADGTTSQVHVLSAGFATGTLDGFCLSQTQSIAPFGTVVIRVTAGDGNATTREINAVNVQFDITELRGNGTGLNLDGIVQMGVASQDVTTLTGVDNPLGAPVGPGWYGIDATAGDLYQVKGYLYDAEIGGPMQLPNLKIQVGLPGSVPECWSTDSSTTDLPH